MRPPPPSSPPLHPLKPCSPVQPRRAENGPSPPRLYRGVHLICRPPIPRHQAPSTPSSLVLPCNHAAPRTVRLPHVFTAACTFLIRHPRSCDTRPPPHKRRRTDSPGGASRRRDTAARFLDLEAAEDRDTEDQTLEDIVFIDDSVRDDKQGSRTGDRRCAPPPLRRLIEEEEPEDLHTLAVKITEHHRAQRPIPQYDVDADVEHISRLISTHACSPTPQDPCLFRVVIPHGEPQLFISRCMTELLSPHMPIRTQLLRNIFISLFHRPGDPHVYIEATPGDIERPALLHLPPPSALETGWARCKINGKRGPFNGDLVFVDAADPVAPVIWAIPHLLRSDGLDALYDKLPDKKGKDKQHSDNFHRLFEPEDYPCNQIQELGDGVYLFKKLTFKDGLLFYTTSPPSFRHYTQLSVEPTQYELDLFSQRPNVIFYVPHPITPMSHMVVVGDRVASWSQNFQGWIKKIEVVIEDCDGQQVEVSYAHVQQLGDKPPKLVRSGSLGLHMLSLPGHICLNDRVCVSGGERGYWNKLGHVIQIDEACGLLKIVDYDQLIADGGHKTHALREVRVNHVWKVFFGGDIVRVTYGPNRGRTGFVIVGRHRNHDGLVQVYDPTQRYFNHNTGKYLGHEEYHELARRSFQMSQPLVPNLVSEDYTANPENAHRDIDTRFFSVPGGWLEFALEHKVDGTQSTEGTALEFGAGQNEDRWRSTSSILQQARVDQKDGQTYDHIEADHLMRIAMGTGNVLQNREVYVDGGAHLVKGEYGLALDFNAARSLPKNMDRRAWLLEALSGRASVYEGAMVRVRLERSNQIVNVPIERLFDRKSNRRLLSTILHQAWAAGEEVIPKSTPELVRGPGRALTPPPGPVQPTSAEGDDADITLPGKSCESTGKWMCIPRLVDKRVDVVIRGLTATLGKHDIKLGRALLRLENHHGYLLLMAPLTPDNLEKKCITVYGLGGGVPQMPGAVAVKPL
ncbi:hypothetical protein DFH07DRAFT_974345 [Mycena maculata]|uniref:Uncharacterized protein n=1 Tax=Mycena maculata TaxID=230809 RepID=A0AAD7H862_9AGAR|nr:hypothetical protein DFH07DRAFT_974345 [Mycena maculata]